MSVKRYAIAAGAAALVFSGVYGAAAALAVDSGALQTGQASLSCDDAVSVAGYGFENETGLVNSVRVGAIDATCGGSDLLAALLTSDGSVLAQGSAVIPAAGGEVKVSFPAVSAEDAEKIQLTIEG